jgi:hypothetical protein
LAPESEAVLVGIHQEINHSCHAYFEKIQESGHDGRSRVLLTAFSFQSNALPEQLSWERRFPKPAAAPATRSIPITMLAQVEECEFTV